MGLYEPAWTKLISIRHYYIGFYSLFWVFLGFFIFLYFTFSILWLCCRTHIKDLCSVSIFPMFKFLGLLWHFLLINHIIKYLVLLILYLLIAFWIFRFLMVFLGFFLVLMDIHFPFIIYQYIYSGMTWLSTKGWLLPRG